LVKAYLWLQLVLCHPMLVVLVLVFLGLLQSSSACSPCCWMCCLQLHRSSRLLLSVVSLLSSWKLAISLLVMSFGMLELLLPGCCWFCCCCLSLAVVIPGYYYMQNAVGLASMGYSWYARLDVWIPSLACVAAFYSLVC